MDFGLGGFLSKTSPQVDENGHVAKVPRLAITNVELTPLALCEICISSSLNTEKL